MKRAIDIVNCAALSHPQLEILRALNVSKDQEEFGGTFPESLEACLSDLSGAVQGYCFLNDNTPIGMVVLKRRPATADWVPENAVSLHGFKIDIRWQGKGFGTSAFRHAVHAAAHRWPEAAQLVLAVDADNTAALAVYRGYGMTDSGPVYSGRIGQEHRLSIPIASSDIVRTMI